MWNRFIAFIQRKDVVYPYAYSHRTIGDNDGEADGHDYFRYQTLAFQKLKIDKADEEVMVNVDVERTVADKQQLAVYECAAIGKMIEQGHHCTYGHYSNGKVENDGQMVDGGERQYNQE
jgi:hypothetical protein